MLTYTRCHICLTPTDNSLVCDRCHTLGEIKAAEYEEFNAQFDEEETDGF